MSEGPDRPVLLLLTSHWVSMLGVTLVTLACVAWLVVLPVHLRGHRDNPYIGLLAFIAIPALFFIGLILIPIGIALGRRKVADQLGTVVDRRAAWKRAGVFFGVMT